MTEDATPPPIVTAMEVEEVDRGSTAATGKESEKSNRV